ncbi:NUDIX domain-containing protein [Paenibacillus sp. SAFN-117]|uniref:NUDIX domain-containing protein n=1 Tax=Paenibacillus sp. SAFN-117 TaxID=3436860 RepID=UPI003F7D0D09
MPVVRVFVLDSEERVLLVKTRHKKTGGYYWIAPGGMIEKGEYSREAAIREVKEETGLDISIRRLVWVEESKNDKGEVDYMYCSVSDLSIHMEQACRWFDEVLEEVKTGMDQMESFV